MEKEIKKEEFVAPVENENVAEEQQVKKPWYKRTWGKVVIAAAAIGIGVGTAVVVKKLKGTPASTATDNAVEVEEQTKETPRENNNFNRRERFEQRRKEWN